MFNQDALKTVTLLYVEDEEEIRNSVIPIFKKLFKAVYIAEDGQEGLELFKKLSANDISVDIIISDINMPNMNGLEMVEAIKLLSPEIPFILTTAHAEAEYFLQAIKLGVTHYAVKPLDIKELILQAQDVSLKKYQELVIENQAKQNNLYIDILDKVSIVTKTDIEGNITFVNDLFCEISGYAKDELIGKNQNIVRHPEMQASVFADLWETIKAGKQWNGKIKNKTKDGEVYILNATIFPIFDESGQEILEYVAIRSVITEEENEKREFKKKVIANIQGQKAKEKDLSIKVKELEAKLRVSNNDSLVFVQEALEVERKKSTEARTQIALYEEQIIAERNKSAKVVQESKDNIVDLMKDTKKYKDATSNFKEKAINLQLEMSSKNTEIKRLTEIQKEQQSTIIKLKDVVSYLESKVNGK